MVLLFAGISLALVCLGFWVDTDEPYPNFWLTVFEFCALTTILFGVQTALYFIAWGIYKLLKLAN